MSSGKNGNSREAILHAALKVIAKFGYSDASVNTIATHAGVNNVTVYRLFGGKENLFREVVESCSDVDFFADGPAAAIRDYSAVEPVLNALAPAYFETIFKNIDIVRIFIVEAPHFDFVRRLAWYMPPAIMRHCRLVFGRLELAEEVDDDAIDKTVEMFVSYIVRRALEYNKHDSIWSYDDEMAADFNRCAQPQIRLLATLLRASRKTAAAGAGVSEG